MEIAEVEVSAPEMAIALVFGDSAPEFDLVLYPTSEPFADAAELCTPPPALTELNEYMEDTDIRFDSISGMDGRARREASGSCDTFESSDIIPGDNLGVSISSTAISSLLDLLL